MAAQQGQTIYRVKLAEADNKQYHVMRFKPPHKCDLDKLVNPTLDRQTVRTEEEDVPEVGEGSEYGRKWKEEARKKKRGYAIKKANPDDQPWVLREHKKGGKHFVGRREGTGTSSSYYLLSMGLDGAFEAYPVKNWYDFVPPVKYNYLNEDEAEERFKRRNKTLNQFSIMMSKKLKNLEGEEEEGGEGEEGAGASVGKGKGKGKKKAAELGLLLTDSDSEGSSSGDSDIEGHSKPQKKPGQALLERKRQKRKHALHSDSEAGEETDEGEVESKEVDYMSDSTSESEQEFQAKQAIREEPKDDEEVDRQEEGEIDKGFTESSSSSEEELTEEGKELKALIKKQLGVGGFTSEDEEEGEREGEGEAVGAKPSSRSITPTSSLENKSSKKDSSRKKSSPSKKSQHAGQKRELLIADGGDTSTSSEQTGPLPKKQRTESPHTITEQEVWRYLSRKPITSKDLVKKFSTKKTEMEKNKIVEVLGDIIKNMKNVEKQKIKGKLYLSVKA